MYEIFVVFVSVRRPQRPVFDELEADDVHFVLILSDEKRIVPPFFVGETDGERVVVTDFDGDSDIWNRLANADVQFLQAVLESEQLLAADVLGCGVVVQLDAGEGVTMETRPSGVRKWMRYMPPR